MRVNWVLFVLLLGASIVKAQQPPPVIFFTDLIYAPNSGGESVSGYSGAYVTIYGNFFGPTQGTSTVTWNNSNCLRVVSWGGSWLWYQKIVVQLGSQCAAGSGTFVVTVNAQTSNSIPFTVGSGKIYFISTSGSDSNNGSFSAPWRTIPYAVQTSGAGTGNVIYAMNGVQATTDDQQGWGAALVMRDEWCHGTASAPNALIAYPGATVQIGCTAAGCSPQFGIRSTDYSTNAARGMWTFAGINFRSGSLGAIDINGGTLAQESSYWRFIGNDVSNANATTQTAFQLTLAIQSKIFGNYIHDIVLGSANRLDQALYLSTDANFNEIGWNEIYNTKGRAALQTHSSNLCWPSCSGDQTGFILHDISIHDNKVHHTNEEAILIDGVDPSIGSGVKVYNNVIYDAAVDGQGDSAHFQLSGDFNQSHGIGHSPAPAWWYNNTVYTTRGEAVYGDWWPDVHSGGQTLSSRVVNNILYSNSSSIPYFHLENYSGSGCSDTDTFAQCGTNSGATNLVFGAGTPTFMNLFTGNINQNPLFVTPGSDFHLQAGSPATGAGVATIRDQTGNFSVPAPRYDIDGRIRPNPPSIGAYEFGSGSITTRPNPPTNLAATVQ